MSPCKLLEQNFENFTVRGRFSKKCKNCSKFSGLATSDHHNSAMITNAENLRLNVPRTGCLVSILPLESNQTLSRGLYIPYKKGTYSNFWQRLMSDIAY